MTRRYRRHAQVFLGVAVLLAGMVVSPATAAEETKQNQNGAPSEHPPAGFRSWEELGDTQDRLNSAANHILSQRAEGFSGLVAAPENRELQVYWKGAVPSDVQERAASSGVPVKFIPARFSQAELGEEVSRLGADKRVGEAAPNVNGSGVTVTVSNDADAEAIRRDARLPVTVNVEQQRPELLWGRQNDISPYWGGAAWYNLTWGSKCSTGFSVLAGGLQWMLSAAHCAQGPPAAFPSNVVRIGIPPEPNTTVNGDINVRDTLLITRPSGKSFGGRIYVNGNCCSSLDVVGPAIDYVGNWICTGGARTGEHCNAQVVAVNTTVLGISPLTRAQKVPAVPAAGNCIAAPGDSGGPAYSYAVQWFPMPPQFVAQARGTITAGVLDTPCFAIDGSGWIWGSYRVWYAPTQRPFLDINIGSLQWYGATLM